MEKTKIVNLLNAAKNLPPWQSELLGDLEGVKIKFGRIDAGKVITEFHEVNEILLVLEGSLNVTIDDKEHVMKSGDCAFIPKYTEHQVMCNEEATFLVARKRDD